MNLFQTMGSAIIFFVGLFFTYLTVPHVAGWMSRHGIVGVDVHKHSKPAIPEMCGISILVGVSAVTLISIFIFPSYRIKLLAFLLCVLIVGLIGVVDDLRPLGAKTKPVLTALACIPIFLLGAYSPHPSLPLVGATRLTIVYPLLLPFAIAVTANAVNMMDVLNGSMAGTGSIVLGTLAVCLLLSGQYELAVVALGLVGCLIAFFMFNRFPSRVFAGDVGSLSVGAAIGAIAIIGRVEVAAIVTLMPHIMNSFYGLVTVGRLYERRQIEARPVRLRDDGKLEATVEEKAPITLTRIILAGGPLSERNVVKIMFLMTALSSALAVVTFLITPR